MTALIQRHQAAVAQLVAARLRPAGEAAQIEDVCQAVFVKMVLSLPKLRETEAFEGWLFQIARNACRDQLRKGRFWRRMFAPLERAHAEVASLVPREFEGDSARLQRAMERLEPSDRGLLALTLEKPRSYVELAAELGLTVAATKSRLFRTRARLGVCLRQGENDDK